MVVRQSDFHTGCVLAASTALGKLGSKSGKATVKKLKSTWANGHRKEGSKTFLEARRSYRQLYTLADKRNILSVD
jgi:hypothetical protein